MINLPLVYGYLQICIPCAESYTLDASAEDSQNHTESDPDMLTDEETATGYYTICCVVMQQTFIVKTRAAY
jgi:hypothetical protein